MKWNVTYSSGVPSHLVDHMHYVFGGGPSSCRWSLRSIDEIDAILESFASRQKRVKVKIKLH